MLNKEICKKCKIASRKKNGVRPACWYTGDENLWNSGEVCCVALSLTRILIDEDNEICPFNLEHIISKEV